MLDQASKLNDMIANCTGHRATLPRGAFNTFVAIALQIGIDNPCAVRQGELLLRNIFRRLLLH